MNAESCAKLESANLQDLGFDDLLYAIEELMLLAEIEERSKFTYCTH